MFIFTFDRLPDFLLYTPPPHSPNCLHKPLSKFTNPRSQRGSSSWQASKRNHFPFAKMSSQTPLDVYESAIIKGKQLCKELASFEAQPPLPASLASCGYKIESGRLNSNTENSLRLSLLSCGVLISNSKKTLTVREFRRQRCSGNAGRVKPERGEHHAVTASSTLRWKCQRLGVW
jgi:hypothetical protein